MLNGKFEEFLGMASLCRASIVTACTNSARSEGVTLAYPLHLR